MIKTILLLILFFKSVKCVPVSTAKTETPLNADEAAKILENVEIVNAFSSTYNETNNSSLFRTKLPNTDKQEILSTETSSGPSSKRQSTSTEHGIAESHNLTTTAVSNSHNEEKITPTITSDEKSVKNTTKKTPLETRTNGPSKKSTEITNEPSMEVTEGSNGPSIEPTAGTNQPSNETMGMTYLEILMEMLRSLEDGISEKTSTMNKQHSIEPTARTNQPPKETMGMTHQEILMEVLRSGIWNEISEKMSTWNKKLEKMESKLKELENQNSQTKNVSDDGLGLMKIFDRLSSVESWIVNQENTKEKSCKNSEDGRKRMSGAEKYCNTFKTKMLEVLKNFSRSLLMEACPDEIMEPFVTGRRQTKNFPEFLDLEDLLEI